MTLLDLLDIFDQLLPDSVRTRKAQQISVAVHSPGHIGGTPKIPVTRVDVGFDWDNGHIILHTEKPLTTLTQEDVDSIRVSVAKGQSWHAYQRHKAEAESLAKRDLLLRRVALFLGELPEDLGRGSLNGDAAQIKYAIQELGLQP